MCMECPFPRRESRGHVVPSPRRHPDMKTAGDFPRKDVDLGPSTSPSVTRITRRSARVISARGKVFSSSRSVVGAQWAVVGAGLLITPASARHGKERQNQLHKRDPEEGASSNYPVERKESDRCSH